MEFLDFLPKSHAFVWGQFHAFVFKQCCILKFFWGEYCLPDELKSHQVGPQKPFLESRRVRQRSSINFLGCFLTTQPVWGSQRPSNSAKPSLQEGWFPSERAARLCDPFFFSSSLKWSLLRKPRRELPFWLRQFFLMFSHHVSIFHLSPSAFCLDCSFIQMIKYSCLTCLVRNQWK